MLSNVKGHVKGLVLLLKVLLRGPTMVVGPPS